MKGKAVEPVHLARTELLNIKVGMQPTGKRERLLPGIGDLVFESHLLRLGPDPKGEHCGMRPRRDDARSMGQDLQGVG